MPRVSSPNNAVMVIGRVFVENDGDLPTAYALAKQMRLTPPHQYGYWDHDPAVS